MRILTMHFSRHDDATKDPTTDRHLARKRTLLVNVRAFYRGFWSLKPKSLCGASGAET
jgi:hypothetical protein